MVLLLQGRVPLLFRSAQIYHSALARCLFSIRDSYTGLCFYLVLEINANSSNLPMALRSSSRPSSPQCCPAITAALVEGRRHVHVRIGGRLLSTRRVLRC